MRISILAAAMMSAALGGTSPARADVYFGTAFRTHELVDRPAEWADVAAGATGYYFHPHSGNDEKELKGDRQRELTTLFKNQRVITERNNGGEPSGDTPQYEWMRRLGMKPVAGLVAEVNKLGPFVTRVAASKYSDAGANAGVGVAVPLFADQRPWTSEWNRTADIPAEAVDAMADHDAELKHRTQIILAGSGFALETDLARSFAGDAFDPHSKHFRICLNMLRYARLHGKQTLLFLHGFEMADPGHYVDKNLAYLRGLEAAGAYPDGLIISFYDAGSKLQMLPESHSTAGLRAPAQTFSGLAWAVLAREGAIDLPATERPRASVSGAAPKGDSREWTIRIDNPNAALDFAPAINVEGLEEPAPVEYAFDRSAFAPLPWGGVPLVGEHALLAGKSQVIRLRFTRPIPPTKAAIKIVLRRHAFARLSPAETIQDISP